MIYTILVHIKDSEPVKLDVDELPSTNDTCIIGKNPRLRTEAEVAWVDEGVTTIVLPWWRINYIQILSSGEEEMEIELPYRDD